MKKAVLVGFVLSFSLFLTAQANAIGIRLDTTWNGVLEDAVLFATTDGDVPFEAVALGDLNFTAEGLVIDVPVNPLTTHWWLVGHEAGELAFSSHIDLSPCDVPYLKPFSGFPVPWELMEPTAVYIVQAVNEGDPYSIEQFIFMAINHDPHITPDGGISTLWFFRSPGEDVGTVTVNMHSNIIPGGPVTISADIKPGSCPNPFNVNSKGVLPVTILGTEDLDVTTIDPATTKITREGIDGQVAPLRWAYGDVATPFEGELCECHDFNGDGYMDLKLKFDRKEVAEASKLWQVLGQTIRFTITGNLKEKYGGTAFSGQDCMWIKPKVKGKAKLEPVGESGVYGKAKLVTKNDGTTKIVLKKFTNLTPGGTHQARVRSGSCNGAILFTLSDVIVNQGGVGRSDTIVDATIDFDTWWIEVEGLTCGEAKLL